MNADEYKSNKEEEWTSLKSNKKDECERVKKSIKRIKINEFKKKDMNESKKSNLRFR